MNSELAIMGVTFATVSAFLAVIFALAITDPLGSVTVPTIVASCPNAWKETPRSSTRRIPACRKLNFL